MLILAKLVPRRLVYSRASRRRRGCHIFADPQPEVRGIDLDAQTRCVHYHAAADIVAIKMRCCGVYWACKDCHEALAGHAIAVWGRGEWNARAVFVRGLR